MKNNFDPSLTSHTIFLSINNIYLIMNIIYKITLFIFQKEKKME